jgi:hypothetical protein
VKEALNFAPVSFKAQMLCLKRTHSPEKEKQSLMNIAKMEPLTAYAKTVSVRQHLDSIHDNGCNV